MIRSYINNGLTLFYFKRITSHYHYLFLMKYLIVLLALLSSCTKSDNNLQPLAEDKPEYPNYKAESNRILSIMGSKMYTIKSIVGFNADSIFKSVFDDTFIIPTSFSDSVVVDMGKTPSRYINYSENDTGRTKIKIAWGLTPQIYESSVGLSLSEESDGFLFPAYTGVYDAEWFYIYINSIAYVITQEYVDLTVWLKYRERSEKYTITLVPLQ